MIRRIVVIGLCAAALACSQQKGKKSGPVVAKGNGISITADEFKARLDEQSPFIRARYTTLDRKKEFLDSLIRFEVLAREAEKQGLAKDPDVYLFLDPGARQLDIRARGVLLERVPLVDVLVDVEVLVDDAVVVDAGGCVVVVVPGWQPVFWQFCPG